MPLDPHRGSNLAARQSLRLRAGTSYRAREFESGCFRFLCRPLEPCRPLLFLDFHCLTVPQVSWSLHHRRISRVQSRKYFQIRAPHAACVTALRSTRPSLTIKTIFLPLSSRTASGG